MCHPRVKVLTQELIDENPFQYLMIDDNSILDTVEERNPCIQCSKSRKYFCYNCYIPVRQLDGKLPKVKLPLKIDIIKHKREIDGKSTAIHAAILAPYDVKIYTYPDLPDFDYTKTVLIFPSNDALTVAQLFSKELDLEHFTYPEPEVLKKGYNPTTLMKRLQQDLNLSTLNLHHLPIERAIFIDSTWNQSKGIYQDDRIKKLQCVVLQNRVSQFWRHQKNSPRWYLSTVEAIHQFVIEIHLHAWGYNSDYKGLQYLFHNQETLVGKEQVSRNAYHGQYDNLLYFFEYMYNKIHTYYSHSELQAYKRPLNLN